MKNFKNAFLKLSPLLLLFLFASCSLGSKTAENRTTGNSEQPNILYISVDDLNDWVGVMKGHPDAITPNLDKLAERGVLFTNAHCQAPLCGPSRASLMTGLRPSTTGIYGMIDDNEIRDDNEATEDIVYLTEYIRDNGYYTMGIGKLFHTYVPDGTLDEEGGRVSGFGPRPAERLVWDGVGTAGEGFGRTSTDWGAYPEVDSLMPDYASTEWAVERLDRDYEKPFMLAVGYLRPHAPFLVPQKWFDLYDVNSLTLPPYKKDDLDDVPYIGQQLTYLPMMPTTEWAIENNEWANIVHAYLACVSFVDNEIGKLLTKLENSKYADNTIIVLSSDHGYRLGEKGTFAKHCLWDTGTKAPLMFAGPGIEKGKVVDQAVEMLSIYPTLLELTGMPAYERNEGISLAPLLTGKSKGNPDAVAITTFGMNNHTVRSKDYRYISYEDGTEELYDHKIDPNEWDNIAGDPNYAEIKEKLKKSLPQINLEWNTHSKYDFQPYFTQQKAESEKRKLESTK